MGEFSANEPSVTSNAPAQAGSFTTEDPSAHEQATAPWDIAVSTPSARSCPALNLVAVAPLFVASN